MAARDPLPLSVALNELIALRGFARVRGDNELEASWKRIAGEDISAKTRVMHISRGVLMVSVDNAPLLSELASYQSPELLQKLKQHYPHLKIKSLKFKLNGT